MEGSERQTCLKVHGLTHGSACLRPKPWKKTAGPRHPELCKSKVPKAGPRTKQVQRPTGWDGRGWGRRPTALFPTNPVTLSWARSWWRWGRGQMPATPPRRFRFLCAHFRASAALDGLGAKCSEHSSWKDSRISFWWVVKALRSPVAPVWEISFAANNLAGCVWGVSGVSKGEGEIRTGLPFAARDKQSTVWFANREWSHACFHPPFPESSSSSSCFLTLARSQSWSEVQR